MPFVITARSAEGPVSVERDTPTEALEKVLDLEAVDFQDIGITGDRGGKLTCDELMTRSTIQQDE